VLVRLLIRFAVNAAALYVAARALSGVTYGDESGTLLVAAAVFTLVNAFVKPVVTVLSIPFIILTLGLFYFLVNVLMLYATDWLVRDFEIESLGAGVLAAIIVSLVNWLLHAVVPGER
jgi:putative membrane protein